MTEKAQIVHANGNKDPVAIVSNKVIGSLLAVFILATLGSIAAVGLLNFRVGVLETKLDKLAEKIENGMDSRWRRSDHDQWAETLNRRLREKESAMEGRLRAVERKADTPPKFPFTERKAEILSETAYALKDVLRRLSECEAKIKEHESGQKHEDK